MEKVMSVGRIREADIQGLTEDIMQNRQFRNWFQSNNSQLLLLKAFRGDSVSPLSVFCAMLLKSLKDIPSVITIHYFCGISGMDVVEGPDCLLLSLLGQLLEVWPREHLFSTSLDLARIRNHDHDTLWNLFVAAVTSLEGSTVFCTIDGLLRYQREQESSMLVQKLVVLSQSLPQTANVTLKILVTSPTPPAILDCVPPCNHAFVRSNTGERMVSNRGIGLNTIMARRFERGSSEMLFPSDSLNIS